jgi:leader peptidase (prepilin peptidase)/N-methyltransferase
MTEPGLPTCVGTAVLFGVIAARLVPRLARRWIPPRPGGWPLPARLSVGAATAATVGLLTWQHRPQRPAEYVLLTAWITFALAGVLLCAVDIAVQRLPSPVIAATATTVILLLTTGGALTRRPVFLAVPIAAAMALGGGYLLLVALGASSAGIGDVRLATLTGLLLGTAGWHTVWYGVLIPYLFATPFAVAAARRHRTCAEPPHISFGPFLIAGAIVAKIMT